MPEAWSKVVGLRRAWLPVAARLLVLSWRPQRSIVLVAFERSDRSHTLRRPEGQKRNQVAELIECETASFVQLQRELRSLESAHAHHDSLATTAIEFKMFPSPFFGRGGLVHRVVGLNIVPRVISAEVLS